jgi:hypothetical protein
MNVEMNNNTITKFEKYKATEKKHGKLEKVDKKYLDVLDKALLNFDDTKYNIEPAKEIMFGHIRDKYPEYTIANFGCSKLTGDTLVLTLRDESLRDNLYLFNTKTGEVYFINETIIKYIPESCNNYNNIITNGISYALNILDDITCVMSFRSDL